jgi:hypothetical protein
MACRNPDMDGMECNARMSPAGIFPLLSVACEGSCFDCAAEPGGSVLRAGSPEGRLLEVKSDVKDAWPMEGRGYMDFFTYLKIP